MGLAGTYLPGRRLMMRSVVIVALLTVVSVAQGQERNGSRGHSVRVEYHYAYTSDYVYDTGSFDGGNVTSHALVLSGVYSINDQWKLFATIPYVERRQSGAAGVHNPAVDFFEFEPPDMRFIDDGSYHGGLQDISFGVQYLAVNGPAFSLSPYLSYGTPVTDYPFYGAAAIGKQLNELHVGAAMELRPYFSDWFFQADITYAFSEEVLGVDLNYWLGYVAAGYYVTPRFLPRIYVSAREAPNALVAEDIDEIGWDSEYGWRHDQALKHSFVNAGIGFDYVISERYTISGNYFKSISSDNIYELDAAFTVGFTRHF